MPRVNINISYELKDYFEKKAEETGATQSSIMSLYLAEYVEIKKSIIDVYKLESLNKFK